MKNKIKKYVENIFDETPKSKKANELKDELIANLVEKYDDLIEQGKTEEEAYNNVIASIGDINELVSEINENSSNSAIVYIDKERKRNAKYIAIAVMLYILSVVPIIYFDYAWGMAEIGVVLMFIMIALATALLVYVGVSKTKYIKTNDTLVEEFREWKVKNDRKRNVHSAIFTAFWLFVVAFYLIISFSFQNWSYSWILFIIALSVSQIIKAILEARGDRNEK